MKTNAHSVYKAYKDISALEYKDITVRDLNILYNIQCKIKRDEKYRAELSAFVTNEGEPIEKLIEGFFISYNARYGLDIRDSLTELENPDLAEGGYFIIETYKKDGSSLVLTDPTKFSVGDTAHAVITLYSSMAESPIKASRIKYEVQTDDGEVWGGISENTGILEFDFTLSRPGLVYFEAIVIGDDGKRLTDFDFCFGGVLFDFEKIGLTKETPKDLYSFWDSQIDRLLKINPTDTHSDGYSGLVKYDFDSPKDNRFELIKIDADYIKKLREYGNASTPSDILDDYDIYELNLKAPGPCHSSNYLSIPKNAKEKSLPILVSYDGYRAFPQPPSFNKNYICLHSSHHGYKLCKPNAGYYDRLREGVCYNYGLGKGGVNSFYENLEDNYMLYLHLRNLQALRFVTDKAYSEIISGLHESWNGNVRFEGVSMGGYQSICTAALSTILLKKVPLYKITDIQIEMPAFCDLAGRDDGRVPGLTYYTAGMEYFDGAHLAGLIDVPLKLARVSLGDTTCAPTGIVAMFNNAPNGIQKEINFIQNSDHGRMPEPKFRKWSRYKFKLN